MGEDLAGKLDPVIDKIVKAGRLLSFQWEGENPALLRFEPRPDPNPAFIPGVLNVNRNLVALSIKLQLPRGYLEVADESSPEHFDLKLPLLRKLVIKGDLESLNVLLQAAPNLTHLEFKILLPSDYCSGEKVDTINDPGSPLALFYRNLSQLRKLRSIAMEDVDLGEAVPFLQLENLDRIVLKWCTNFKALKTRIRSLGLGGLHLREFEIFALPDEILPIKWILESLKPGLETLIVVMNNMDGDEIEKVRKLTSVDESIYIVHKDAVKTLCYTSPLCILSMLRGIS
ncbi:hypothetical protein TWF481_010631 [Arthrobotrys musiformis]|uniref:F-box domain-containing protein n=1 Tax=Arthrobotrys musiformis TaxID=47236 RepID=A0AAV9W3H8_9PEZI